MCIMFIVNGSQFVAVCIVPVFKLNAGILVDFYGFFFSSSSFPWLIVIIAPPSCSLSVRFSGGWLFFRFPRVFFSPAIRGVIVCCN